MLLVFWIGGTQTEKAVESPGVVPKETHPMSKREKSSPQEGGILGPCSPDSENSPFLLLNFFPSLLRQECQYAHFGS